jgi:hypothetical protein
VSKISGMIVTVYHCETHWKFNYISECVNVRLDIEIAS